MSHLERLSGIFPPMATPFCDQKLDLDAVVYNIEKMNQTGVLGVMPLGSNGEFRAVNDEETVSIIKTNNKHLPPDKTLIAGAGRDSAYYTVEMVKRVADAGADYASIVTPHYFAEKMTDEALCRYYEYVADRSPIPLLLYCVPIYAGGVVISYAAVKHLAQHENIVGMKDTTKEDIAGYIAAGKDGAEFHVLAGTIKKFLGGLKLGAVGGVLSVAVYLPQLCAALHTCQRQKCRASVLILLQICDHPLCSLFIVRHNILDTASKRCLHCNFIFFFYLDDVRHNTDQTFFPVLAAHNTTDAVSVSVISFCNIFQRLQSGGFSVICSLSDPQFFLLLIQLALKLCDVLFIDRDQILKRLNLRCDLFESPSLLL